MKFNFLRKKVNLTNAEKLHLEKISQALFTHRERMVEDIMNILEGNYGLYKKHTKNDIHFCEFELKVDGYSIDFYPMNSANTQLGYLKLLPEFPNGFVRDLNLNIDDDDYDFDNDLDMARLDEVLLQLEANVLNWFKECWVKAGGLDARGKYALSVHESKKIYKLKSKG